MFTIIKEPNLPSGMVSKHAILAVYLNAQILSRSIFNFLNPQEQVSFVHSSLKSSAISSLKENSGKTKKKQLLNHQSAELIIRGTPRSNHCHPLRNSWRLALFWTLSRLQHLFIIRIKEFVYHLFLLKWIFLLEYHQRAQSQFLGTLKYGNERCRYFFWNADLQSCR